MEATEIGRLKELGQFLRSRRERISPEQIGLPKGSRRRTPGLRRAEVALLAGVSVEWYTWLEQGRDINVSVQVIDSIAKALQLDANERKHLYLLALQQLPTDENSTKRISPSLQHFLDLQKMIPAYITDQRLNIVAWNKASCYVLGNFDEMSDRERNTVWRAFTCPLVRQMLQDHWEDYARRRLAQFRAKYARFAGDPWWVEIIEELHQVSPVFTNWWNQHDVLDYPEGQKVIHHPHVKELAFEHLSFQVCNSPDLIMTINTPLSDFDTPSKLQILNDQKLFPIDKENQLSLKLG